VLTGSALLDVLVFALIGFAAQMIDGALGMAYGVSSTTLLLSLGVPPATASASVHTAEMFTTAASGLSHFRLGNIQKDLFTRLIIPGVIGGVAGAYLLTTIPTDIIKPLVSVYLLVMGVVILFRAFNSKQHRERKEPRPYLLGLVGGFFDAIGGGGWGPIVTSTLVADGHDPRFTVGSVNASEFFVTTAQSVAFIAILGSVLLQHWATIVGLLVGGVLAAPLAAYAVRRLKPRLLMILVGTLIIVLSLRTIVLAISAL
jgi:hypothetical protein